jgi:ribose transport system substrate-binding protein
MKRSLALLVTVVMLISIALVGCGGSTAPAQDTKAAVSTDAPKATEAAKTEAAKFDPAKTPITICMPMKIHPVHRIMETGFLSEAETLGYTNCTLTGIDDLTQPAYIAACEAGITNGIKGMLVYAYDPYIYPTIKKLSDAGIIVVTHHTPIPEGNAPGISVNVGGDPIQYSKNAAKILEMH